MRPRPVESQLVGIELNRKWKQMTDGVSSWPIELLGASVTATATTGACPPTAASRAS